MDDGYIARNDTSRAKLGALLAAVSSQQLDAPLADRWTPKVLLAHLAWWDRYMVALLADWIAAGFEPDISTPPMRGARFASKYDNAAGLSDWLALPADTVRREVRRAAEEVDAASADVLARLRAAGLVERLPRQVDRSVHRLEHVSQIETQLLIGPV